MDTYIACCAHSFHTTPLILCPLYIRCNILTIFQTWKLRSAGTKELSWIPAPVGTRIQVRLVFPSLWHWMGICLLVQVRVWWTIPSPEARLYRTLWCAAGQSCPCWSRYVDDGPVPPRRPGHTELWQIRSYVSEKLCVDEPACACLTQHIFWCFQLTEGKELKNFKEIADLLFITEGLTWWLSNLTARTFDDNQQFNFFLNLDFFFFPSTPKPAKNSWEVNVRRENFTDYSFFFFFFSVKVKVKTKLIRRGYL